MPEKAGIWINARRRDSAALRHVPERDFQENSSNADDTVQRTALLQRVLSDLEHTPVILFVAPPGYGKSCVIDQYRRRHDTDDQNTDRQRKEDDGDAEKARDILVRLKRLVPDVADFTRLVLETIRAQAPAGPVREAGTGDADTNGDRGGKSARLEPATSPDHAARIAAAMGAASGPVVLVIDEYHLAQSDENDAVLRDVIARLRPDMRLLIATRQMPAIGVRKLELQGGAAVYGVADLAFTSEDTHRLFNPEAPSDQLAFANDDDERLSIMDAETLTRLSMGWPASLSMARRWLDRDRLAGERSTYFQTALAAVFPYLEEEAYPDIPGMLKEVMEKLAILPAFDSDAIRRFVGAPNPNGLMLQLAALEPYVIEVDPRRQVYRFQPVMKAFLEDQFIRRRGVDALNALYQDAATYYKNRGETYRALNFARKLNDRAQVEEISFTAGISMLRMMNDLDEFNEAMEGVSQDFDGEILALCPAQALYAMRKGDFDGARKYLDCARDRLDEEPPVDDEHATSIEIDLMLVDAYFKIYAGGPDAEMDSVLQSLQRPSTRAFSAEPMYLGILYNALAGLLIRKGSLKYAQDCLTRSSREFDKAGSYFSLILNGVHKGMLNTLEGNFVLAMDRLTASKNALQSTNQGHAQLAAIVELGMANVGFETGAVKDSRRATARALDIIIDSNDYWEDLFGEAYISAARTAFTQQGFDAADRLLLEGIGRAKDRHFEQVVMRLQGAHLHFAAIAGREDSLDVLYQEYKPDFDAITFGDDLGYQWRDQSWLAIGLIRSELYYAGLKKSHVEKDDAAKGAAEKAVRKIDDALKQIRRLRPIYEKHRLTCFRSKMDVLEALAVYERARLYKDEGRDERGVHEKEASRLIRSIVNSAMAPDISDAVFVEEGALARDMLRAGAYRFRRVHTDADGFKSNVVSVFEKWFRYNEYLYSWRFDHLRLTAKQTEVLIMVEENRSYNEMCEITGAIEASIAQTIAQLRKKFGVDSREELAALVRHLGILDAPQYDEPRQKVSESASAIAAGRDGAA